MVSRFGKPSSGEPEHTLSALATSDYHSDGRTWDIKTDSSCGYEVATPAISLDESGNNDVLRRVCEELRVLGPLVNNSCGYHLHIACQDYTWDDLRRLLILWTRYEPFF